LVEESGANYASQTRFNNADSAAVVALRIAPQFWDRLKRASPKLSPTFVPKQRSAWGSKTVD